MSALATADSRFPLGAVVTDRLIRGRVIATHGTLCKVEYNLWPGEPARTVWVDQDDLLPCDGALAELRAEIDATDALTEHIRRVMARLVNREVA